MRFYRILRGNHPSNLHGDYLNEQEAQAEVERLELARLKYNKQIDEHPATGHGANVRDNQAWSYIELEQ